MPDVPPHDGIPHAHSDTDHYGMASGPHSHPHSHGFIRHEHAHSHPAGAERVPSPLGNSGPGTSLDEPMPMSPNQVIAEQRAQIARLQAELDGRDAPLVLYCTDAAAELAMETNTHEEPGTILRATDTMRAWQLGDDREWHSRP